MSARPGVVLALVAIFAAYVVALGGLGFPLRGDEAHFWYNAVAFFGGSSIPSAEALRTYPELNTPLPLVVWGTLEHALHQGVWLPRALNLSLSFAVVALIALEGSGPTPRSIASAAGVLACPYYLFVSGLIYTDMPAIACGVFGLRAHLQRRHTRAAWLMTMAIACRQYAAAFPLAILAVEISRREHASWRAMAAAGAAALSLVGWMVFFGGVAPAAAIAAQDVPTARFLTIIPQNGLYLLSCVGLYFALPRWLMVDRTLFRPRGALVVAMVTTIAAFAAFPPTGNVHVPTVVMGLFDRMLHAAGLAGAARVIVLCAFAIAAIVAVWPDPLARALTVASATLMLKGHLAWDKHALPLLAALWLLTAREAVVRSRRRWTSMPGSRRSKPATLPI